MTTYATRSPLQPLHNPHMMSDSRKAGRRTSDRLREKEDAPLPNGFGHGSERLKSSQSTGAATKQTKVNGNDTGASTAKGRGKRKIDYDEEESDGFMFTRTRSKKPKSGPTPKAPEPIPEIVEEESKPAPPKKTRKKAIEPTSPGAKDSEAKPEKRRRSARNSGESVAAEPPQVQVKKRRVKEKDSSTPAPAPEAQAAPEQGPAQGLPEDESAPAKPAADESGIQNEEATKIALPFADTPIQRRNKEMRANSGQRRSSLGNRGRRASSLIDSGKSNAMPHDDVEPREFYKHIESGLPEPRRMRQLLTWCGTRALIEKPSFSSEDSNARLAAREIQQQLLKDFSVKSDMSDWFSRRESTPPPQTPKPNPKNLTNLSQIADLEQKIARLQTERHTWESLLQPPHQSLPSPAPHESSNPHTISSDLLSSPAQLIALASLQSFHPPPTEPQPTEPLPSTSTLHISASSRIQHITTSLEFEIDTFAGNMHALKQYQTSAGRVADELLGISADALEERESIGRERERENAGLEGGEAEAGSRDVLRALSKVIDR